MMTLILSSFGFIHPLSETMIAPSLDKVSQDLHIISSNIALLCVSIFLLGIALGPLALGPLSEMYGRKPVLLLGGVFYIIWNTGCGFAMNQSQLLAFRALSGFGASAAVAVAGGVLSDLWQAEDRGKALAVYIFAPLLGPALGPILGGFLTSSGSWRWVFWSFSILSFVFVLFATIFFRETYEPKLLQSEAKRQRKEKNNPDLYTEFDSPDRNLFALLRRNLVRPLRMISTQPIVQILSVYMALLYGIMFLFLFTYPMLWTSQYHQSIAMGSLNYISAGLGFTAGTQGT
jgi:multidrug resistance protein